MHHHDVAVFPKNGKWFVKFEGKVAFVNKNKPQAMIFAKNLAKENHAELLVYGEFGIIKRQESYCEGQ